MVEPETSSPLSPSPSPSRLMHRFQLQPDTPEIPTRYASNPNLVKRMQGDTCFRCHQQGHWSWYCPLNSPNNNASNKTLSPSPNHNHSPVSPNMIRCRCGHGFCEIRTARNSRNWGRKYYVCPIKRGARCKEFIKWCDDPIDETDQQPPLLKYPECECGAGVCRREKETTESPSAVVKYYFACPIKQDHGSCGYRVSEDELLNSTSIVPVRQSRQRSLDEFWEGCQNDPTDSDLGNDLGEGGDLLVHNKRMRIMGNSENPSMAVSEIEILEGRDGGSIIKAANSQFVGFPGLEVADDDIEFTNSVSWEAIEAEAFLLSRLSTPSRIHYRQSLFQRDIFAAAYSLGSCPMGWLGRLIFFHPIPSLKFPTPQPFFCCIFPSFDPIVVPKQTSHTEVSRDVVSPSKSPGSESKPMSKTQRHREVALFTQQRLLSDLENLDPHQHELMTEVAETTFALLNLLGIECKQFSDHVWDFISLASSMDEMDKSIQNSPTLEEHNKLLEEERVRLACIRDECIKTETLLETSYQQRKLLCEQVSHLEALLQDKKNELRSCELETVKIETKLGDLKQSMLEADISVNDRVEQVEVVRRKGVERHAKKIAAMTAMEKAKLALEN